MRGDRERGRLLVDRSRSIMRDLGSRSRVSYGWAAGYIGWFYGEMDEGIAGWHEAYDALIAMTAVKAQGTLVTRDMRAAGTYRLLNADYELVVG